MESVLHLKPVNAAETAGLWIPMEQSVLRHATELA